MKTRLAISTFAMLLMATPAVWAQGAATHAADPPLKVGVISMQSAISGTAEGKQQIAQLQSQFASRQAEIAGLQKQMQDLQTKIQSLSNTASEDEKLNMQSQLQTLNRTATRKNQDLQDDENEAEQEMLNRIGRKMLDVLNKYAGQNGYAVILDNDQLTQQIPMVLFRADQVDVTQEIVHLYDQTYPVKAAATTPKPAPKPAPKPQR
ncbi:MAG TPA: OmpH family outer membrane protein [Candidatus Acidoferrales bacterium]|nr:OmpH family outer membrane protein [Candidatus Acidoferrales bacterium]